MKQSAASLPRVLASAFCDWETLRDLEAGCIPKASLLAQRLFLAVRNTDLAVPDHVYRSALGLDLPSGEPVWELLFSAYSRLATYFIERRSGRLAVRSGRFEAWQETIASVSPLALAVSFLVGEGRFADAWADPRAFLQDELDETALLRPMLPALDHLIERDGLNEIHMHLNGSTEADVVWADATRSPHVYLAELTKAHRKHGPVRELFAQLEPGLTPSRFHRRLIAIRRVRHLVADRLTVAGGVPVPLDHAARMLNATVPDTLAGAGVFPLHSPPSHVMYGRPGKYTPLVDEAAFLFGCISRGRHSGWRPAVGLCLHANALVFAQLSRLAVHHPSQSGFDQFQKVTLAGTRESLERRYEARFRQVTGPPHLNTVAHLEGRFAPKGDWPATAGVIKAIVDGYLASNNCVCHRGPLQGLSRIPRCLTEAGCPRALAGSGAAVRGRELSLVAHFIKSQQPSTVAHSSRDGGRAELGFDVARFAKLRQALDRQAHGLRYVIRTFPLAAYLVRGIDAAANELDAPPEVFAPCFRLLRPEAVQHATYHVGEDFRHLTSGIRAVAEAVEFLGLGPGDRIGHATAIGIDPALWLRRIGPRVLLPLEDALDDAVFAHGALCNVGRAASAAMLARTISTLSVAVYGEELSPAMLEAAWSLRSLDAREVVALRHAPGVPDPVREPAGFGRFVLERAEAVSQPSRANELKLIAVAAEANPSAYMVAVRRHDGDVRRRGAAVVEASRQLDADDLCELQEHVLEKVGSLGIPIEALPTSNVRISFYRTFGEHHVFRWLGLNGPVLRTRPDVCVGSDDPGIFATSLANEYAHLFEVMVYALGLPEAEASTWLRRLNDTGRAHRFRPGRPHSANSLLPMRPI